MTRATRNSARFLIAALAALMLLGAGCSSKAATPPKSTTPAATATDKPIAIKIGTLATEDSLPLWVAEKMGYFATQGIPKVEIINFQSAQERDTAFASGAIDGFMGDIVAAANLEASGKKVTIATVMLGADKTQGRFGIVVPPKSTFTDPKALAGVPVGTSSATIQEYVLDGLMLEAGVPAASVKVEEVKKVPVRFELLMAGKLKAAALPEPFLTLAEQGGAKVIGDDTKAQKNLSQTVLVLSEEYLAKTGGQATETALLKAWDLGVNDINKAPETYRDMLVDKARLPKPLASVYKVQTYPAAQAPSQADVEPLLAWMSSKGYLKGNVGYADLVAK